MLQSRKSERESQSRYGCDTAALSDLTSSAAAARALQQVGMNHQGQPAIRSSPGPGLLSRHTRVLPVVSVVPLKSRYSAESPDSTLQGSMQGKNAHAGVGSLTRRSTSGSARLSACSSSGSCGNFATTAESVSSTARRPSCSSATQAAVNMLIGHALHYARPAAPAGTWRPQQRACPAPPGAPPVVKDDICIQMLQCILIAF